MCSHCSVCQILQQLSSDPLEVFQSFVCLCILRANLFDDNLMISPVLRSNRKHTQTHSHGYDHTISKFAATTKIRIGKRGQNERELERAEGVARQLFHFFAVRTLKTK